MPRPPPAQRSSSGLPDGRFDMDGFARWILTAIPPRPDRVPYLRQQALHVLQLWQLEEDLSWRAELLLSELATNAVRHARTPFTIMLGWNERTLRGEVSDVNPNLPLPQQHVSPDALSGRGLILVEDVSSTWGVEAHQHGKTVWFTLNPSSSQAGG